MLGWLEKDRRHPRQAGPSTSTVDINPEPAAVRQRHRWGQQHQKNERQETREVIQSTLRGAMALNARPSWWATVEEGRQRAEVSANVYDHKNEWKKVDARATRRPEGRRPQLQTVVSARHDTTRNDSTQMAWAFMRKQNRDRRHTTATTNQVEPALSLADHTNLLGMKQVP